MKQTLILLSICIVSFRSFSQDNFSAGYVLDKSSVIYVGVPNPISIISNYSKFDYSCSIDNGGRLERSSYGRGYNLVVDTPGYYTLTIKAKNSSAMSSFTLRAKQFSIPHANLERNFGGQLSMADLQKVNQLSLDYVIAEDFDIRASVLKFSILRIAQGGQKEEIHNEVAAFTKNTKDWINKCQTGDILIFKGIKGADFKRPDLDIPDVVFYIN